MAKQDNKGHAPTSGSAADILLSHKDQIISDFIEQVKSNVKTAHNNPHPILEDTFPLFILNLIRALKNHNVDPFEGSTMSQEHGGERARLTQFTPEDIIKEYQILRQIIFATLKPHIDVTEEERQIILTSIDHAMTESLTAFFLVHTALREQFMLTLTHDLRNPLSAVLASAQMIIRYVDKPDRLPIIASRIVDSTRRMDRMIQDLLDASRVQLGQRLMFELSEFDLDSLVKEVLDEWVTIHGNRFDYVGRPVIGYWNEQAFKRALENLLGNALKYGSRHKRIDIKLLNSDSNITLSVHNFDSYIPAEDRETLFRTFMRASGSSGDSKDEGWGIGLAQVRGMAEAHGGSILIESTPEHGTTFTLNIPIDARPFQHAPITPGVQT